MNKKETMEGFLSLRVTTIQGQGEMNTSLSTQSGLTKEKWIGQLDAVSTVRLF